MNVSREQRLRALLAAAQDLTRSASSGARYERLLASVHHVFPCDAAALLRLKDGVLVPLAVEGLLPETMGQQFDPRDHPRLAAILSADGPVRFAPDDPMPDPYDGLVAGEGHGLGDVHSCMGCALTVDGEPIGTLTLDALQPGVFDAIDFEVVRVFAALAAAAVRTAEMLEALEGAADRQGRVARHLLTEAMRRGGSEILGRSSVMDLLREEIQTVARSELTVLVTGETGTGKELVARTIHASSARADKPLVYVNCAALPESIAESELFGHAKGAFTGAVSDRMGKFELADGATLFLDEVGEMPLSVQPLLLRALQFGELQRVGSDRAVTVDVRVIAATNRDLVAAVEAGTFRRDLYHRLSVYPIDVPPLREHPGDLPLLTGHFLDQARSRLGSGKLRLSADARDLLVTYDWPGNVRELEHVVMRAALRAARSQASAPVVTIGRHLLGIGMEAPMAPPPPPVVDSGESFATAVDDCRVRIIRAALDRAGGNWADAARALELDRSNLHRLARRLGLKWVSLHFWCCLLDNWSWLSD